MILDPYSFLRIRIQHFLEKVDTDLDVLFFQQILFTFLFSNTIFFLGHTGFGPRAALKQAIADSSRFLKFSFFFLEKQRKILFIQDSFVQKFLRDFTPGSIFGSIFRMRIWIKQLNECGSRSETSTLDVMPFFKWLLQSLWAIITWILFLSKRALSKDISLL